MKHSHHHHTLPILSTLRIHGGWQVAIPELDCVVVALALGWEVMPAGQPAFERELPGASWYGARVAGLRAGI